MNRRRLQKRAFTLIELLVVIAIIAILAAILFPVFAQAKAAAKASVAISNVKQLSLGSVMYSGDNEDMVVRRVRQDYATDANGNYVAPVLDEVSWKGMIAPYVKSVDLYRDPANSAAKWPDLRSRPETRTLYNWQPINLPNDRKFVRGYAIANLWFPTVGFQDSVKERTFSTTMFSSPATTFFLTESKLAAEDVGPFAGWSQSFDAATGLQWNLSGDKWSHKANVVGFQDGHAKRMPHSQWCGQDYMSKPDGSTEVDAWNMDSSLKSGWAWIHNQGCGSLPAAFR